jgi:hypothetical protein
VRVTLAYPQVEGYPDDVVSVDEARGRQLIADGFARPLAAADLTVAELDSELQSRGYDTSGAKPDKVARLEAAGYQAGPAASASTTAAPAADQGVTADGR